MRSALRIKILLDKSFGKVKYFFNGTPPANLLMRGMLNPTRSCLFPHPVQPRTQAATENQHNTMQNYCKTIGALAAASALVAGNASAEVEYEIHTGYTSEYIFRGADLGDDLTELGLDVATEYEGWGFSGGVWATAFDSPAPDQINSEVDFYGEVSRDFGFMTAAVGYIYYWNVGRLGADAQEVYLQASRDFGFATASLTYFVDIEGGNTNGYTELGLTRSFELNSCLALNVGTNVGYYSDDSDFSSWTTKVGLDWGFVENAKLSPFVALSVDLADVVGLDDEFVAGSMLSVSF
jgi:uncharacterized protein (TIGR02001 family)